MVSRSGHSPFHGRVRRDASLKLRTVGRWLIYDCPIEEIDSIIDINPWSSMR
jgi:hypothetical protein